MCLCSGLDAVCKHGWFYGYHHKFYLEERETRVKLKLIDKETAMTHTKEEAGSLVIFWLEQHSCLLCVQLWLWRVFSFGSLKGTEQPCHTLRLCKVYIQGEDIMPASSKFFFLSLSLLPKVPLFYSLLEYGDVPLDHICMESHIDFLLC